LFSGIEDTLFIGLRSAENGGYQYALALANKDRSAIVLNVEAGHFFDFKKKIGFGALLRNVVKGNSSIIYAALQDTSTILAGYGQLSFLDPISDSEFLTKAYTDSLLMTHNISADTSEVFEAVHPFIYQQHSVGLFRLGLSMKPIYDINERIIRRLIIITIVLVIIGFILFTYIFTRQRLDILHKQYQVVESYSGSIIDNVSDAIIVYNDDDGIMICNDAAARLFAKSRDDVIQKPPKVLLGDKECGEIADKPFKSRQIVCTIKQKRRYLFISKSQFTDSNEIVNTILVIRDLTEQKSLEEKMERKQRLTAMGELASGVAHEIRNPLNAIGTIVQQLDKDFNPREEEGEYHELLKIVYTEVKRIDETIKDFLRFARPEPIAAEEFDPDDLIDELGKQYGNLLKEKNIEFLFGRSGVGKVVWDRKQIKQVLINILNNAADAVGENGKIIIDVKPTDEGEVDIRIADNGQGMPQEVLDNIFNLYYTTKAKGTGIGLSIVQRIIYEHHGYITVESEKGKGTVFNIRLPRSSV
jgi:signal transduction histidine kinase